MNLVVLVIDSLRADAPGYAGGPPTPTLDTLAAQSCRFDEAHCAGSWTVPSLAAIEAGRWPHQVGVANWRMVPRHTDGLFNAARRVGLAVHGFFPNPLWAFRGWPDRGEIGDSQDLDAIAAALRGRDRLIFVHHWWTHFPYVTRPRSWSGLKHAADVGLESLGRNPAVMAPKFRALYHRAVHHWSEEVLPRLLEACAEDTILMVTADHGESWGELVPDGRVAHIFDLHGRWIDDTTAHVPWLVWGKGVRPGLVPGFVSGVDLAPTLAELSGLVLGEVGGRSRARLVREGGASDSVETWTIGSHNTVEPECYPEQGDQLWRRFSLRRREGRVTWDAVTGQTWTPPGFDSSGVLDRMRAEHARAAGPAAVLPNDATRIRDQLRLLGYLE